MTRCPVCQKEVRLTVSGYLPKHDPMCLGSGVLPHQARSILYYLDRERRLDRLEAKARKDLDE